MFCNTCGKSVVETSRFCSNCGTPVLAEAHQNAATAAAPGFGGSGVVRQYPEIYGKMKQAETDGRNEMNAAKEAMEEADRQKANVLKYASCVGLGAWLILTALLGVGRIYYGTLGGVIATVLAVTHFTKKAQEAHDSAEADYNAAHEKVVEAQRLLIVVDTEHHARETAEILRNRGY